MNAPILLETAVTVYLDDLTTVRQLSLHTINNYRRDLQAFIDFCHKRDIEHCQTITPQHVRHFISERHSKQISGKTLQRNLSSLRGLFAFFIKEDQLEQNPANQINAPKTERRLPHVLDVDQTFKLIDIDDTDLLGIRDKAILELFYSSGLRLSELVSLDINDVDKQDRTITALGKNNKERVVLVGSHAIKALQRWLDARHALLKQHDTNALFLSKNGTRLKQRSIQQRLAQWGIKQGIDRPVHPHMLRHCFASHLLESSGDIRSIQELLGHADIATTQIYTHLDFQHLASVYDKAHPRARNKTSQDID